MKMGWLKTKMNQPEFWLVLLMKHQSSLHIVKKVKLKTRDMVKIGKREYIVDIENPTYIHLNRRYYFVNSESGALYTFYENENGINANDLDVIVGNKIIRELTSGVMDNKKTQILYGVIGAIIGLLAGIMIMNFVQQGKIEDLYVQMLNDNPTPIEWPTYVKMMRGL